MQLEIDRQFGGPDAADVIAQDGDAAEVSLFAQTLKDLLRAVRMAIEQSRVMRPLKGSRTLLRGRERRGSKRERLNHLATVCGWRPSTRAVCAMVRPWRSWQSRILQKVS